MATPASKVVGAIATGPTRFFVQKKAIVPMLNAIKGGQQNQFTPPVKGLADREDSSGKFARKIGQNRRALERIADMMQEERQDLVKKHAERFPEVEIVNGVEQPHPQAGQTTPVYATAQDGVTPLFKKNRAGQDTEERVIAPDQYNLADPMGFQRDTKELLEEWVVIECPGFTVDEFETFKGIAPRIVDPLMDLEVGGASNASPDEQIAAYRTTAAMYEAAAARMESAATSQDERDHPLAAVDETPVHEDKATDASEDRSAP
jgi:hypothetical protein